MPAIVTNDHRILAADYFQSEAIKIPIYVFIGGTSQWADENDPPDVNDTTLDKIFAYEELVGMKRIQPADMISVLPRVDWTFNTVYDEYRDDVNLIDDRDPQTGEFYKFYVITDEFNVYKCISNNYGAASTTKPSGTSIDTFQTPDGYIWKFMYTVRSPDAFTYMTPNWIPCYTLRSDDGSAQWLVQSSAVPGTIDNVLVTEGGAGYTSSNPPSVDITGNGTGAEAIAEIDDVNGVVSKIVITNPGEGYTNAEVNIISNGDGVGAEARPIISPFQGHGADARSELGATFKLIRVIFESDEGGSLPIGVEYRKAGLISLPSSKDSGVILTITDTSLYQVGETITGHSSGATGDIRVIDGTRRLVYLENVNGSFTQSETISSQSYNSTQVNYITETDSLPLTLPVVDSTFVRPLSGDILYFSTRQKISRGLNQTEEIRFVISF